MLKIQGTQTTIGGLGDPGRLIKVILQLTFRVSHIHQQEGHQKEAFIATLQGFQERLGFSTVGDQVAGKNVHVITRTDGFLLFFDFHLVQVSDLAFDQLDRFSLLNALNM